MSNIPNLGNIMQAVETTVKQETAAFEADIQTATAAIDEWNTQRNQDLASLHAMGFNSREIDAQQKLGDEHLRKRKERHMIEQKRNCHNSTLKLAALYREHQPNNLFITDSVVERVCKEYGLVCQKASDYIGTIPDKNRKEIMDFRFPCKAYRHDDYEQWKYGYLVRETQQSQEDIVASQESKRYRILGIGFVVVGVIGMIASPLHPLMLAIWGVIFGGGGTAMFVANTKVKKRPATVSIQTSGDTNRFEKLMAGPNVDCLENGIYRMAETAYDNVQYVLNNPLIGGYAHALIHAATPWMLAPAKLFAKIVPKVVPQIKDDPIVLQPVLGGYLVITAWGPEAADAEILNPTHN